MIIVGTFISSLEEPTLVCGVVIPTWCNSVSSSYSTSLLVTGGDERNDNKLALDVDPDAGTGSGGWKWNRRTFSDEIKM
jgi:hypothetical protein